MAFWSAFFSVWILFFATNVFAEDSDHSVQFDVSLNFGLPVSGPLLNGGFALRVDGFIEFAATYMGFTGFLRSGVGEAFRTPEYEEPTELQIKGDEVVFGGKYLLSSRGRTHSSVYVGYGIGTGDFEATDSLGTTTEGSVDYSLYLLGVETKIFYWESIFVKLRGEAWFIRPDDSQLPETSRSFSWGVPMPLFGVGAGFLF